MVAEKGHQPWRPPVPRPHVENQWPLGGCHALKRLAVAFLKSWQLDTINVCCNSSLGQAATFHSSFIIQSDNMNEHITVK